ncbi:hypothetical protein HZU67_07943 [Apis mellifera carnica]|nr:hypothetical protein HZU67_07943 [Apis mellifera carnica]
MINQKGTAENNNDQKKLNEIHKKENETKPRVKKYITKHMKFYVICRHRVQKTRKQIRRQMNRNIMHFAMMQMFAIDSVRIDRVFSFGIPQETLIVPDLLNKNERRHINELLRVK